MGSGASLCQSEKSQQQSKQNGEKEEEDKSKGKGQSKRVEIVTTYASVTPGSIIPQMIKKLEWREALKNKDLTHSQHRKLRAAALGLYMNRPMCLLLYNTEKKNKSSPLS